MVKGVQAHRALETKDIATMETKIYLWIVGILQAAYTHRRKGSHDLGHLGCNLPAQRFPPGDLQGR